MDPVVHFQIPADDTDRMRGFYEKAFGWQTNQLGEDMGSYVLVTTTPIDEENMITKPGAINGGFSRRVDDPTLQSPTIVIRVEDINESMKNVVAAGGRVTGGVNEMPQIGLFATFTDTEGNRIMMMQPEKPVM
jgi:predicted enzyme related to lactoylglutathione lyase